MGAGKLDAANVAEPGKGRTPGQQYNGEQCQDGLCTNGRPYKIQWHFKVGAQGMGMMTVPIPITTCDTRYAGPSHKI